MMNQGNSGGSQAAEKVTPASELDAAFKMKWLAALRSGDFQQCQHRLHDGTGYCCIGVAALAAGYSIDCAHDRIVRPSEDARNAAGYVAIEDFGLLRRGDLIAMNDAGKTFSEIADYIEANL